MSVREYTVTMMGEYSATSASASSFRGRTPDAFIREVLRNISKRNARDYVSTDTQVIKLSQAIKPTDLLLVQRVEGMYRVRLANVAEKVQYMCAYAKDNNLSTEDPTTADKFIANVRFIYV